MLTIFGFILTCQQLSHVALWRSKLVRKKPGVVVGSDDTQQLIEELRKRI